MEAYIIKSSVCLLTLIVFYLFLLRKDKLLLFNRYYLLFSLLFSFTIPFFKIELSEHNTTLYNISSFGGTLKSSTTLDNLPALPNSAVPNGSAINWFLIIYLSGGAFFLFRFSRNLLRIVKKVNQNLIVKGDSYNIVLLNQQVSPSSFFKFIFLDKNDFNGNSLEQYHLIEHEKAHVKQFHSIDILFIEILQVIFWFNPLLILYKKNLKIVHEYLADNHAINISGNAIDYQNTLLNFVFRNNSISLASSFNYSLTKNRLKMITKSNRSRLGWIKMLSTVPLIMALTMTIACSQSKTNNSVKELIFTNSSWGEAFSENSVPLDSPGVIVIGRDVKFECNGVKVDVKLIKLNKQTGEFITFVSGKLFPNKVEASIPKGELEGHIIYTCDKIEKFPDKIVLKGNGKLTCEKSTIEANEIVIHLLD